MRANATGLNSSQPTLKLPENGNSLQAAGAATLKQPPKAVTNATSKLSSVMTLKPHQAVCLADVETVWDPVRPVNMHLSETSARHGLNAHCEKMAVLPKGVDRMSGAFKDATKTKEEKRRMMDNLHETAMERVEKTRQEMDQILAELAVYLKAFYSEYEEKLKVTMEELRVEEEERIVHINERFQVLEERQQRLAAAIIEETETRLHNTEAILGPARRSVELLVVDLDKERRIRETRNDELNQRREDAVRLLADSMTTEENNRALRHEQVVKELDIDTKRLQRRGRDIAECNVEKVALVQEDIIAEEKLRKETQDDIVVTITSFIQNFQAHVKEEGAMGC